MTQYRKHDIFDKDRGKDENEKEELTWTKTDTCSNGAICQNVFVLMIESFYIISQLWDGNLISGDDDDHHHDDDLDVIGHC